MTEHAVAMLGFRLRGARMFAWAVAFAIVAVATVAVVASGRQYARGGAGPGSVWVDVAGLYGPTCSATAPDGLVLDQPCPGGLSRWVRSSAGWLGVVTMIVPTADGGTTKLADQFVPARFLRPR